MCGIKLEPTPLIHRRHSLQTLPAKNNTNYYQRELIVIMSSRCTYLLTVVDTHTTYPVNNESHMSFGEFP